MLPQNHPQRHELNDEVHARPPEALAAPLRISYVALNSSWNDRRRELDHVRDLAERFGAAAPAAEANHYSGQLGPVRLKWERHTEFARYTFIAAADASPPFTQHALNAVPPDWLKGLPGELVVASHVELRSRALDSTDADSMSLAQLASRSFGENALVGSAIAGGSAEAFTDFRIHGDGFSRLLVIDHDMSPHQAGRMVQRLLEIDTYRVMALLALPVARELNPFLTGRERELAEITAALATHGSSDESRLLERLTMLEAEIDSRDARSHFRFAAAAAYYELVQRRIADLREERIQGIQTFREFVERRLAPAINTCRSVAERQKALSERVARTTQLLSTRVDIARQRQNQALLASMDRRSELQLRLQATVEGLSVAAITYYVVGLIGYAAKSLEKVGSPIESEQAMGLSILPVALLVALALRGIRHRIEKQQHVA